MKRSASTESFNTYNEFAGLDYNKNGNLERAEWHWSNVSFTQRDTNRDGRISQAEFSAGGRLAEHGDGAGRRHADGARQFAAALDRHQHHGSRGRRDHLQLPGPDPDERQRAGRRGRRPAPPAAAWRMIRRSRT